MIILVWNRALSGPDPAIFDLAKALGGRAFEREDPQLAGVFRSPGAVRAFLFWNCLHTHRERRMSIPAGVKVAALSWRWDDLKHLYGETPQSALRDSGLDILYSNCPALPQDQRLRFSYKPFTAVHGNGETVGAWPGTVLPDVADRDFCLHARWDKREQHATAFLPEGVSGLPKAVHGVVLPDEAWVPSRNYFHTHVPAPSLGDLAVRIIPCETLEAAAAGVPLAVPYHPALEPLDRQLPLLRSLSAFDALVSGERPWRRFLPSGFLPDACWFAGRVLEDLKLKPGGG